MSVAQIQQPSKFSV